MLISCVPVFVAGTRLVPDWVLRMVEKIHGFRMNRFLDAGGPRGVAGGLHPAYGPLKFVSKFTRPA